MRNWKKWTIFTTIALLIGVNFYLIFKKDSEVVRSKHINEWRTVQEQNLTISRLKEGVVAPAELEYAYFQKGVGDFERFLVEEGEEVVPGTPLFEYSPQNFDAAIEQYEAEITKLESEQAALEDQIQSLERLEGELKRPTEQEEGSINYKEAEASTIRAQIFEKEYQLDKLDAEIEKLEELISISDDRLGSLTVNSTMAGVVKKISHDLQNPVVTITSNAQQIKGLLEEEEMYAIGEGMKVIVTNKPSGKKMEGYISKVAVNPEHDPHVKVKSQYEFLVEFAAEEEAETADKSESEEEEDTEVTEKTEIAQIHTGSHVDLKIITREIENALTLPEETIRNGAIYVLMGNGKIEKRDVQTGIGVNSILEIIGEVEAGEFVVNNPSNIKNETAFFTPVKVKKLKGIDLSEMRKKDILRYLGRGFLSS